MKYSDEACKQLVKVGQEIEQLITCCLKERDISVADILTAAHEGTLRLDLTIVINNPETPLAIACEAQHRDGKEKLRLFAVALGIEQATAH